MTKFTFILKRAIYQRARLVTLSLGILLATILLASSPALSATVTDYSLRRDLENRRDLASNVQLTSRFNLEDQLFSTFDLETQAFIRERFDGYIDDIIVGGKMLPLTPWRKGQLILEERINLRFYGSTNQFKENIEFIEGEWPAQWEVTADYIPVLIPQALADAHGLTIGSNLPLSSNRDTEAPTLETTVVGIIQPKNKQNEFWFGSQSPFQPSSDARFAAEYSILMPAESLIEVAMLYFPERNLSIHWNVLVLNDHLTQADIDPLIRTLQLWKDDVDERQNLNLFTDLDDTLLQFKAATAFTRSPLFFIVLIVGLLALFYIVLVSALSLAQTEGEYAVLISRGANRGQIISWQGIESLGLFLFAMTVGPLIAWVGLRVLSRIGPLGAVGSPEWSISFPRLIWATALLGALAAVLSSFIPLPATLRSSVVTYLQRRIRQQEQAPWWQRYYADVMLLIVGGVFIIRLPLYGSILGDVESAELDWLLLLAPAFLLFGTATIFLRVFPLLLQLVARLTARYRGLSLMLVLWQIARQPRHVSRLLLLLTITTALGLFSTTLNSTLSLNETTRARFMAIGAQRLSGSITDRSILPEEEHTFFWRSLGRIGASLGEGGGDFELLGLDPQSFNQIADYRDDFANSDLSSLLTTLEAELPEAFATPPFIELPGQPHQIELYFWIREEDAYQLPNFRFHFKFFTATDEYVTVAMSAQMGLQNDGWAGFIAPSIPHNGQDENGWARFTALVPQLEADQYPLSIASIWMQSREEVFIFPEASPAIDQISIIDGDGNRILITGFEPENRAPWFETGGPITPRFENRGRGQNLLSEEEAAVVRLQLPYEGDTVLALPLFYQPLAPNFTYGIHTWQNDRSAEPLPVLATHKFMEASGSEIGDTVIVRLASGSAGWVPIRVKILDTINYFPTLFETEGDSNDNIADLGGSLVTIRDPLLRYVNTMDFRTTYPNEIAFSERTDHPMLLNNAAEIWDFKEIEASLKATPLVLGLRTVTIFGYILSAVLSLAGFATYFFLNTQQLGGSYAILRALGMSVRQLYATLLIEQVILVVTGLVLGTGLGLLLAQTTLQNLAFRTGDISALPPFNIIIDWRANAILLLTLTSAIIVTLGLVTVSLWRLDIHRVLRVGEE